VDLIDGGDIPVLVVNRLERPILSGRRIAPV
jgi:hypothetical protein